MWFAIVIACLSVFEYGSTCNVGHGKYFVVEIRIKQANKNNKNFMDMVSFLIGGILLSLDEFEDTNRVIRIWKSNKDKQCNGQKDEQRSTKYYK